MLSDVRLGIFGDGKNYGGDYNAEDVRFSDGAFVIKAKYEGYRKDKRLTEVDIVLTPRIIERMMAALAKHVDDARNAELVKMHNRAQRILKAKRRAAGL